MSRSDSELLFETIQIRDGVPRRLDLHEARMNRSREYFFGSSFQTPLRDLIDVPENMREGIVKCRIVYCETISSIAFAAYTPRVHSGVKIVDIEAGFSYDFKYTLRQRFDQLEAQHPDKAIILSCNGIITDATYANVALYDGSCWVTPKHCLLNGVMRQWLLAKGIIEEAEILESDLSRFSSVKLINAMLEWEESAILPLHYFQ
jgi:4-amino-4-deoxychorismate lyase